MSEKDLSIPAVYAEDDTPRRFKDLLNKPKFKRPVTDQPIKDDFWTVRPGETFRDFNARIREAGLSTPPGIPTSFRGSPPPKQTEPTKQVKPAKKFAAQPTTTGEVTKRKRKEFLKKRKEQKRQKVDDHHSDYDEYEVKGLRDVVKAPPQLKFTPKATTLKVDKGKMKERAKGKGKGNPSLLPFIKKTLNVNSKHKQ
jgi:hypothetical protein